MRGIILYYSADKPPSILNNRAPDWLRVSIYQCRMSWGNSGSINLPPEDSLLYAVSWATLIALLGRRNKFLMPSRPRNSLWSYTTPVHPQRCEFRRPNLSEPLFNAAVPRRFLKLLIGVIYIDPIFSCSILCFYLAFGYHYQIIWYSCREEQ